MGRYQRLSVRSFETLAELPRPPHSGVTRFVLVREHERPGWLQVDVCPTRLGGEWAPLGAGVQLGPEALDAAIAVLQQARELLNQ